MTKLNELLCNVQDLTYDSVVCIAGDFNGDFCKTTNNRNLQVDLLESFNLHRSTLKHSEITDRSESCIDNIFTNLGTDEYRNF